MQTQNVPPVEIIKDSTLKPVLKFRFILVFWQEKDNWQATP